MQEHFMFTLQVMVWKSNFDCAEFSDGVRLQHKTTSSSQAPPASSMAHPPFNSHPSVLRSQVSSDIWRQPQRTDSKSTLMSHLEPAFYASPLLLYTNYFLSWTWTHTQQLTLTCTHYYCMYLYMFRFHLFISLLVFLLYWIL